MAQACPTCGGPVGAGGSCFACAAASAAKKPPAAGPALRARDPGFKARHSVEAGAVISTSVRHWIANLAPFLVVTVVTLSPLLIYGAAMSFRDPEKVPADSFRIYDAVNQFGGVILRTLAQAAIIGGVFLHMRGDHVATGALLRNGLARVFPALWTAILAGILTFLPLAIPLLLITISSRPSAGLLALAGILSIVGMVFALIISTALYVSIPASVVEKCNGFPAIKRSMALTKGSRGQIFVVLLAIGILAFIVGFAVEKVPSWSARIWLHMAVDVIGASFGGVFAGVVYYNLRALKEGIGIETLAKVFD